MARVDFVDLVETIEKLDERLLRMLATVDLLEASDGVTLDLPTVLNRAVVSLRQVQCVVRNLANTCPATRTVLGAATCCGARNLVSVWPTTPPWRGAIAHEF